MTSKGLIEVHFSTIEQVQYYLEHQWKTKAFWKKTKLEENINKELTITTRRRVADDPPYKGDAGVMIHM